MLLLNIVNKTTSYDFTSNKLGSSLSKDSESAVDNTSILCRGVL